MTGLDKLTANSAFHLSVGLAFARPTAGECERSPHRE